MSWAVPRERRPVGEPVPAAPRRAEVLAALSLAIDLGFGPVATLTGDDDSVRPAGRLPAGVAERGE
jgi:hypothetical protein